MAPSNSKANYKTYEAQARLVRAIVAAHPDVKWNYKGKHMTMTMISPYVYPFSPPPQEDSSLFPCCASQPHSFTLLVSHIHSLPVAFCWGEG